MRSKITLQKIFFVLFLLFTNSAVNAQYIIVLDSTESRCAASGTALVTVGGGSSPYLLRYKPLGAPDLAYSLPQSDTLFVGLAAGQWTLQVIDNANNTATTNVTIPGNYQDPVPVLDTIIHETFSCTGCTGVISVHNNFGRPPHQYRLRIGGITGPIIRPFQSSGTFNNVCAGTYTIQTIDSCGVIKTEPNITVNPDPTPPLGYQKWTTSGSYRPMGQFIPVSCNLGSVGIFNTYASSTYARIYQGTSGTYHDGDTASPPTVLIGGMPPYTYRLKAVDLGANTGSGLFSFGPTPSTDHGLNFDATAAFTLHAFTMYATSNTATADVVLLNSSNVVLQSKTINLRSGYHAYELGFNIPSGTGYKLVLRNIVGSTSLGYQNITYPIVGSDYTINNGIQNSTVQTTRQVIFYDWVTSPQGTNPIAVSNTQPLFHNVPRTGYYCIEAEDACGKKLSHIFNVEPELPLRDNIVRSGNSCGLGLGP